MLNYKKYRHLLRWIPAVAIMAVIFYFSSRTGEVSGGQSGFVVGILCEFFGIDGSGLPIVMLVRKLAHFMEFFTLGAAVVFAFMGYRFSLVKLFLLSAGVCLLCGAFDELHQLFVPGRSAAFIDVFIDFFGAAAGIGFMMLLYRFKRKFERGLR